MTIVFGAIGFALLALTILAPPAAAYSMVAVIETQTQGPLACGNTTRGLEGTQTLLGISDEIALAANDAAGGDPGGALQVRPVVIIKELDRCTPPLFLALVHRERIRLVEIRFFDRQGVHFFTIRLEDALVTRISRVVRSHGLHEEVAFAFRGIQLIDERSGASASHQFSGEAG
jgi:type VI secretion system secreted protein Hcp